MTADYAHIIPLAAVQRIDIEPLAHPCWRLQLAHLLATHFLCGPGQGSSSPSMSRTLSLLHSLCFSSFPPVLSITFYTYREDLVPSGPNIRARPVTLPSTRGHPAKSETFRLTFLFSSSNCCPPFISLITATFKASCKVTGKRRKQS